MFRYLAPLAVFVVMVLMFIKGLDPSRDLNELPSPFLGKPAPSIDLPSLENPGGRLDSRDYAGDVALVNVWATWCVGCRQEHEFLMELSKTGTLPIYGINWRDRREEALAWLASLGDPYVVSGFDADGRTGIDWGVYGAPETFLIGKNGNVLHKHLGPLSRGVWEQDFMPLINNERGVSR